MITDEKVDAFFEHHGIKGMHWGVRNEKPPTGFRLQTSALAIDPSLPSSTKVAAKKVSSLINERYGFHITSINNLKTGNPQEFQRGTVGYVKLTPGSRDGVIFVTPNDVTKQLKMQKKLNGSKKELET